MSTFYDAREVVAEADEHDLYLIGRIGVFQDDFYAAEFPDSAVLTETGSLWRSNNGFAWLDPSDPSSYEYAIALAEEACRLGFDEIQFDYVSYPFGGDVGSAVLRWRLQPRGPCCFHRSLPRTGVLGAPSAEMHRVHHDPRNRARVEYR